jgi:hypothetical protein
VFCKKIMTTCVKSAVLRARMKEIMNSLTDEGKVFCSEDLAAAILLRDKRRAIGSIFSR